MKVFISHSSSEACMYDSILRRARVLCFLSVLIVVSDLTSFAQTKSAELHGVLTDPSGNRVPSATITLRTLDTGLARSFTTASDGSYAFLGLRPGSYTLRIQAAGFRAVLAKEIALTVGQKADLS